MKRPYGVGCVRNRSEVALNFSNVLKETLRLYNPGQRATTKQLRVNANIGDAILKLGVWQCNKTREVLNIWEEKIRYIFTQFHFTLKGLHTRGD